MTSHSKYLTIHEPPPGNLDHLVIAYGGWPDAAESATNTIKYLVRKLEAKKFAEIDPEEFFVFTQERPRTSRTRDGRRRIRWPANEFYQWTSPTGDKSNDMRQGKTKGNTGGLMFLLGMEPNLRWRTFSNIIADLAQEAGIKSVIHVGALLDAVPHTRPVRLTGSSTQPDLQKALDSASVGSSNYQGPTGISTAVMEACALQGIAYASLWGHTSHYVQAAPNYRISYTLAKSLVTLLDLPIDLTEISAAANTFDAQVLKAIDDDDQLAEYIKKLEDKYDESVTASDMPEPADVVRELEQFLRSRRISGSEDGN